jgi:DNA polymerase-3 subunit delta
MWQWRETLMDNKIILYSKSEYSILKKLNSVKKGVEPLNISEIDIKSLVKPEEIISKCETLPLMGKKRVIIIKADFLYDDYKDKLGIFKCLKKYVKSLPNFTILVLYVYKRDKREKISRRMKGLQKQGMELIMDSDDTLEKKEILKSFFKDNKLNINSKIIDFMINSSSNLDMFVNDLDKLKFMDIVSIEKVKDVFCSLDDDDILDLLNAISENRKVDELRIINVLLDSGLQPVQIIRSIEKQYNRLIYCKSGMMANKNYSDIAKEYKLNQYFCKRLCSIAKKYQIQDLAYNLEICNDLDKKIINTGELDVNTEMEMMIIKIR